MIRIIFASCFALAAVIGFSAPANAQTVHEVIMYNVDPDNRRERMIYAPAVIRIQAGDSVRFVSEDKGHNAELVAEMMPEGAEVFKTALNATEEVTFTVPGVYGYKCTPHYPSGMVGLIIVEGEGWDANLGAAKEARHRGKAKRRFEAYFEELDTVMAAAADEPAEEVVEQAEAVTTN